VSATDRVTETSLRRHRTGAMLTSRQPNQPLTRHIKASVASLIFSCILGVTSVSAQTASDAVDVALSRVAATATFPGFCSAVVDRDSTRFLRAHGYADLVGQRPYTATTVQPVGSISKTLIGIVLAKTSEEGTVQLDAPVNALLPFAVRSPSHPDATITLRQLATHTSGITDREATYRKAYVSAGSADTSLAAFLTSYFTTSGALYHAQNFSTHAPGTAYLYSNVGAALAAYALEAKTGVAYAELVQRAIFTPLAMRDSRFRTDVRQPNDAVLYDAQRQPVAPYTLVTYPDGGLRTSCADLARLLTGVLAAEGGKPGSVMSKASVQQMLTPQFSAASMPRDLDPKEPNQGLFWQFRRSGGIGHSGGDPGVTGFVLLDSKAGTGRLFMTNVDFGEGKEATIFVAQFNEVWRALATYEATLSRP
jgi:CubicO group peptidase (beta-lactamase class C family)